MLDGNNQYTYLRKELLYRFFTFLLSGDETGKIDRIPYEMIPLRGYAKRCCIYKDREMVKYRLLALMGYEFTDDFDESFSLGDFYRNAEKQKAPDLPAMTVIKEACSSCKRIQYEVTERCRGCLARPCQTGCPVKAISFNHNRAVIDKDKCINCGKCRKACPYGAVAYNPVPCEEVCPVGAVIPHDGTSIEIDRDKCISCGKCTRACPFGAVVERSHILPVVERLGKGEDLTLLIAPSLYSQLPGTRGQIVAALLSLGFTRVYELKESAEIVAEREGAELKERLTDGDPFMTTSCCPAYVESVRRHIPTLEPFISHTPSPMEVGASIVKELYPGTRTVFAGPCVAKKAEAASSDVVDYVVNFEELGAMLVAKEVEIGDFPETGDNDDYALGIGFARSGGVAAAVKSLGEGDFEALNIDGLDSKTLKILGTFHKRPPAASLVEVMACAGGCVKGPCSLTP